jgi:hypothetical protein
MGKKLKIKKMVEGKFEFVYKSLTKLANDKNIFSFKTNPDGKNKEAQTNEGQKNVETK